MREEGGYIHMKVIALYLKQGWKTRLCGMVKDTINEEDKKMPYHEVHQIIQESCLKPNAGS